MSELLEELRVIKSEIDSLEHSLVVLEDAAWMDGELDEEEAYNIDQVKHAIRDCRMRQEAVEQRLNSSEEDEEEESLFGAIGSAISEAAESVADALTGRDDDASGSGRGSVGDGGDNDKPSVERVQEWLNAVGAALKVDGLIGPKTIGEIKTYQDRVEQSVSGLITPGDPVWRALEAGTEMAGAAVEAAASTANAAIEVGESVLESITGFFDDDNEDDPSPEERAWGHMMPSYMVFLTRISALEAYKYEGAEDFRKDADQIQKHVNNSEFAEALELFNTTKGKMDEVWPEFEEMKKTLEEWKSALAPIAEMGKGVADAAEGFADMFEGPPDPMDDPETFFEDFVESGDEIVDTSTFEDGDFIDRNSDVFVNAFHESIAKWAEEDAKPAVAGVSRRLLSDAESDITISDIHGIMAIFVDKADVPDKIIKFAFKALRSIGSSNTSHALAALDAKLTEAFEEGAKKLRGLSSPVVGYDDFADKFVEGYPDLARDNGARLHKRKFEKACKGYAAKAFPSEGKMAKAYAKFLFDKFSKDSDLLVDGQEDFNSGFEAGYAYIKVIWRPLKDEFTLSSAKINDVDKRIVTAFKSTMGASLITDLPIKIAIEFSTYANEFNDFMSKSVNPAAWIQEMIDLPGGAPPLTVVTRSSRTPGNTDFKVRIGASSLYDEFKKQKAWDILKASELS